MRLANPTSSRLSLWKHQLLWAIQNTKDLCYCFLPTSILSISMTWNTPTRSNLASTSSTIRFPIDSRRSPYTTLQLRINMSFLNYENCVVVDGDQVVLQLRP